MAQFAVVTFTTISPFPGVQRLSRVYRGLILDIPPPSPYHLACPFDLLRSRHPRPPRSPGGRTLRQGEMLDLGAGVGGRAAAVELESDAAGVKPEVAVARPASRKRKLMPS